MAATNPLRAERWDGLLGSLEELAVKTSMAAICLPLAVIAVFAVSGRPPGHDELDALPRALLVVASGAFVLVPMLALAGETTALAVASTVLYSGRRGTVRSVFLVTLGAWALATAIYFDAVIIPDLTG